MKIQLPEFEDKKDLFSYLVKNNKDIIELKKSVSKTTDSFGVSKTEVSIMKEVNDDTEDNDTSIDRTIIGNTYNWMDSHDDVHLNGLFGNSIKERKDKIWHLHDHLFEITAKVGIPKSIYENNISWKKLGVNKSGTTQALFMDSSIMKELNLPVFMGYKSNQINQHSVNMNYVKLFLCINDDEYKEQFANWNTYIKVLGNPDKAEEKGFFWAVQEAKLKEISCVLEGSNELTPTLSSNKVNTLGQPLLDTDKAPSSKTSLAVCPSCLKSFNYEDEELKSGSAKCPGCGKFVPPGQTVSTFDWSKAIKETKFIKI